MDKDSMYVGVEAEGRLRGVRTLFSGSLCPSVQKYLEYSKIPHVCLGCRGYVLTQCDLQEIVEYTSRIQDGIIITVQHPLLQVGEIPVGVWSRCHVLLYHTLPVSPLLLCNTEIKLEDRGHCAVFSGHETIDITYAKDRNVP